MFLIIEHLDSSIGIIEVKYDADHPENPRSAGHNPAHTSATDAVGYTCLGTGSYRRAIFRLAKPVFLHRQNGGSDIAIAGVKALHRVELTSELEPDSWQKVRDEIPIKVESRVVLKNPLQLVMTVGVSRDMRQLPETLNRMQELCPVAKALGFNGVETYVAWNFTEPEEGVFDWHLYDTIVYKAKEYGLKWFPLLIGGSSYALPDWYHNSGNNIGFKCLEHDQSNNIQTIFCDNQTPYVKRFIEEFGKHYEPMDVLLGIRLGPSGNYGESQYPAGGNWGYKGRPEHIHIGWWAGDQFAEGRFQSFLKKKYGSRVKLIAGHNYIYKKNTIIESDTVINFFFNLKPILNLPTSPPLFPASS